MNYKTFGLQGQGPNILIPAPSPPNFIGAGLVAQVTNGQPQIVPANATVQYFNLTSISYACAVNSNLLPVSCTIQISGLKAPQFGGGTSVQQLVFDKALLNGELVKQYDSDTFPEDKFSGLVAVTVDVLSSGGTAPLTNVLLDNMRYRACINT